MGCQHDPAAAAGDPQAAQAPTEAGLKQLMRDPRYWKHQDPAIVEQVRDGFRRLYHEKG